MSSLNFLVVGQTKSGKSTFINTLLEDKRALENEGKAQRPEKLLMYRKCGHSLTLYDTPGFENEKEVNQVFGLVKSLKKQLKEEKRELHMVFYLINASKKYFSNEDIIFLTKFEQMKKKSKRKIPVVFVLTHCEQKGLRGELIKTFNKRYNTCLEECQLQGNQFPQYENVLCVELLDKYNKDKVFGLYEIFEYLHSHFSQYLINQKDIFKLESRITQKVFFSIVKRHYLLQSLKNKSELAIYCKQIATSLIASFSVVSSLIDPTQIRVDNVKDCPYTLALTSSITQIFGLKQSFCKLLRNLKASNAIKTSVEYSEALKVLHQMKLKPESPNEIMRLIGLGLALLSYCEKAFEISEVKSSGLCVINEYNEAIEKLEAVKKAVLEKERSGYVDIDNVHMSNFKYCNKAQCELGSKFTSRNTLNSSLLLKRIRKKFIMLLKLLFSEQLNLSKGLTKQIQ